MRFCQCGTNCGRTLYPGRWYAHDCPWRIAHLRELRRLKAIRQRARRGVTAVRESVEDIPAEEIERRYQAAIASIRARKVAA